MHPMQINPALAERIGVGRRCILTRRKRNFPLLAVVLAGLLWAAAMAFARAQWLPQWVNFYSVNSTLDGESVPVGAVVVAYDPTGVACGTSTVVVARQYPLLPCLLDDPTTPEDDGADVGDIISFTINDLQAVPVPISLNASPVAASRPITWTNSADRWEVDLSACTLIGDFDCNCRVDVGDIQQVAARWGISRGQQGYYPPYDPGDDGIDTADIQRVAVVWRNSCQ